MPMYKHSTQKNHRHIVEKHLLPRFGDKPIADVTRQEIQAYVAHLTQAGYAPKTIDHIHDVLSAVLRTAVKWGHLQDNPARGVDLPTLQNRPTEMGADDCAGGGSCSRRCRRWHGRWWAWRCCRDFGAASCSRCAGGISTRQTVSDRAAGRLRGPVRHAEDGGRSASRFRCRTRPCTARGLASSRQAHRARRPRVLDVVRQADLAEQRAASAGSSRRARRWDSNADLADVSAHLLLVGAREGRARQGRGAADGPREGRHDVERVHTGGRRRAEARSRQDRIRIVHDCSQTGTGDELTH